MIELKGKYNDAIVYTDLIDESTVSQIVDLCGQEFAKNSKIRIMPDCHSGKGCVIGTTMTIKDKVVPNLVGVDIGCGVITVKLKDKQIDFQKLDEVIRKYIPSGMNIRKTPHRLLEYTRVEDLRCVCKINTGRADLSLGTLGSGNHYMEADVDKEGNIYLVVHTGSRNLGKQVAEYYQNLAIKKLTSNKEIKQELIKTLKEQGREKEIQSELKKIKETTNIPKDFCYLEGSDFEDYIHDMRIVQQYANFNRLAIVEEIVNHMGFTIEEKFITIHNYIDTKNMILRKGSISAQKGEKVLIPLNMRDGSIIAIGKGNEEWNCSAPHGAGRILSRNKAKEQVSLDEYKKSMEGIWTTSVNESTIDESPMVYKPMELIIDNIQDTVDIVDIIKPVYNYKAN